MHRATNVDAKDHRGITPMMMAARLSSINIIEELIEANADINAADKEGKSALHWAAQVNYVEVVKLLLERKANKDMQDNKVIIGH